MNSFIGLCNAPTLNVRGVFLWTVILCRKSAELPWEIGRDAVLVMAERYIHCALNHSLHMNPLHIVKILKQLLQEKFGVVGQVPVFHANQGQPLGQGLSFVV